MYRYSVDNAVTYTPSDFKLFRESPFAIWMERLTLENPEHGILPDVHTTPPEDDVLSQDELVETLREEGRDVVLVAWDKQESERRADTLHAMRSGADFIVNGVLALGPLCGTANLLMRTSGYSDLGDYLYVPCETQERTLLDCTFRLCFLADMLHSLQGQLPPQMLLVRGEAEVMPLQTDDHIYYYRAVKMRFMEAMRTYRKHRMPDPSESSHFGRWSDCAAEVLKQRAVSADYQRYEEEWGEDDEQLQEQQDVMQEAHTEMAESVVARAGSGAASQSAGAGSIPVIGGVVAPLHDYAGRDAGSGTLADRALQISPGAFKGGPIPGHTPNLARFPRRIKKRPQGASSDKRDTEAPGNEKTPAVSENISETSEKDGRFRETLEDALQNLAFIGSSLSSPPANHSRDEREQQNDGGNTTRSVRIEERGLADAPLDSGAAKEMVDDSDALASGSTGSLLETSELANGSAGRPPLEVSPAVDKTPATENSTVLAQLGVEALDAPAPNLREPTHPEPKIEGYEVEMIDLESLELEPSEPLLLPPENVVDELEELDRWTSAGEKPLQVMEDSLVDMDSVPPPNLAPVTRANGSRGNTAGQADSVKVTEDSAVNSRYEVKTALDKAKENEAASGESGAEKAIDSAGEMSGEDTPAFSSSLITNQDFKGKS